MITKLNFTDRTIKSYAIRKLTPKECFRLMGVRDNVIGTMQSSNAQAADGWEMTSTSLQLALYSAKQKMELSYSVFTDKGVAALGDEFQLLFKENMERKKDAN